MDETWDYPIHFNGIDTTYAYQLGYTATQGQPNNLSVIIVDFGRQDLAPSPTPVWSICYQPAGCSKDYETDDWVKTVASNFIQGYSAGHSTTSVIAIATSNDDDIEIAPGVFDHGWDCTDSPQNVGANWQPAGTTWANLVLQLSQSWV